MKVYIANRADENKIGGGFTFLRNFKKGIGPLVQFCHTWQEADVILVPGIMMSDLKELEQARAAGKNIVFRVDNVPRKSRNRRSTPHERMKDVANLADVVVYQSEWAKQYCYPLTGDGTVIYNGVDKNIFYPPAQKPTVPVYLFAYYGKNELKGFWQAHCFYQEYHRQNNGGSEFWFVYDFGRDWPELEKANYDFWNGEQYRHLYLIKSQQEMADIMRQCTYLIYPAIYDASPNIVLEARACGLEVLNYSELSGTPELLKPDLDISIERMAQEYYSLFKLLTE